jgi:hypothetical protein
MKKEQTGHDTLRAASEHSADQNACLADEDNVKAPRTMRAQDQCLPDIG